MKKLLTTLAVLLTLQACSHNSKNDVSTDVIKFVESSGKIEIEVKGDQWQRIKSKGSAAVVMKDELALEQAMYVATLRAKANLVEFLEDDIKSAKATDSITKALRKEDETNSSSAEAATTVTEAITSEARSIIKGAYVIDRTVSANKNYVSVTIVVDRKMVTVSKQISKFFN